MSRKRNSMNNLEMLFELYEQKMYRIAFAILRDEKQAEDAVMSSFEKIMRQTGVPDDPHSEEANRLVNMVVRQCAIDQYRLNARERSAFAYVEDVEAILSSKDQYSDDPQIRNLERHYIIALIDDLDEPYKAVIRERFLNERTVHETAEVLGISEVNVRKRQQRALAKLKLQIERI